MADYEDVDNLEKYLFGNALVNGRQCMVKALDVLMADRMNIQQFMIAAQGQFTEDPVGFFRDVMMPLIGRDIIEANDTNIDTQEEQVQNARKLLAMEDRAAHTQWVPENDVINDNDDEDDL